MLSNFAFYYIIANIFCIVLLLLLLTADRTIVDSSERSHWFKGIVWSLALYFAADSVWCLIFTETIPRKQVLASFINLFLSCDLNFISFALCMYASMREGYTFADTDRRRNLFAIPGMICSFLSICPFLFIHDWVCDANGALTGRFQLLFLLSPALYSTIAIVFSIMRAAETKDREMRKISLNLALFPVIMMVGGGIEVLVVEAPLFSYVSTACMIYIYLTFTIQKMTTDTLTGLRYREGLSLFVRRIPPEDKYGAFMVDMNGLKMINDVFGHLEGDNNLRAIALALTRMVGERKKRGLEGYACRFGGDEFFAVMQMGSEEELRDLEGMIRNRIRDISGKMDLRHTPEVAVGAAYVNLKQESLDDLIHQADERMYAEKRRMEEDTRTIDLFKDDVTGLPNANYFHNLAKNSLSRMTKDSRRPILIFFDVYGMHVYNDRYGYAEGNNLLKLTADAITDAFPGDLVVRYTDDHFLAVTAREDVEKAVRDIDRTIMEKSLGRTAGIRAGGYIFTEGDVDVLGAVDRARKAKNYIGDNHNRRFCLYDEQVDKFYESRDYILGHFGEAIREGWIVPYYQPHVRLSDGMICGSEALARWIDPEKGPLSPGVFIPVLEETHQVYRLDLTIITAVCRQLAAFREKGISTLPVSVNLSGTDFLACDIFGEVDRIRRKFEVPASSLKIEVTESALNYAPDRLREAMGRFREAGYEVWMDDFGSDYSSLGTLKDYSFDLIKLDMTLMRDFGKNPKARIIIKSIVEMADRLGFSTLCEGVETMEQYDFLKEIGCGKIQGYLISKPAPVEKLVKLVEGYG